MPETYGLIFLGNPGRDYAKTRHNIAWRLPELLSMGPSLTWSGKFKSQMATSTLQGRKLVFLKPETFMNLSGESSQAMAAFYRLPVGNLIAIHDDIELPFGEVRFQKGGGLGGHKGLKSMVSHHGSPDFYRLRLGIGRPVHGDVANFVLQPFTGDEEIELSRVLPRAAELLETELSRLPK